MRVLAIDPGMKHTGIALVDELGVVRACTLAYSKPVKTDRGAMMERCETICDAMGLLLDSWEHDVVVMEQFDLRHDYRANALSATQGIWLEGWLLRYLVDERGEEVHLQTPLATFSPQLDFSIWWYLGANKPKGMEKEDELRHLAAHMPGGEKCHGERDQIQAAAHGMKYILDHERLFD